MIKNPINNSLYKWFIVIVGLIMFMCLGSVYSWSVFKSQIETMYNVNASLSALPYTAFLVSYTISMVLTGKYVDKYDPRLLIIVGGISVGTGWFLSSMATSFYIIVLTYGIIAGTGVGIAYAPPIKVISKTFTNNKGIAIGLLLSGFGLSPLVTAPFIKYLINKMGVTETFKVLGILFLILIPLFGLFFKSPTEQNNVTKILNKDSSSSDKVIDLLKNTRFKGLWTCFVIGTSIGLTIIGISSQLGEEVFNINSNTTAMLLSLFAIFNAAGRPLFGWITDRFSTYYAAMLSFTLIFLSALLLYVSNGDNKFQYIISLSLLWMNLGAWLSIAPTSTSIFFGEENYSRNYSLLFTAYGVGAIIGTPIAGFIRTRYGSYQYIFLPIMILTIFGISIARFTLKEKSRSIFNK